ncbi:13027_t:CDS:2 [Ambispora leptoticha]|uniref:13027_t:CDS:1 n=1 Tax=Ambispora leptoticha TaxID=144679 RepID=A0A9N8WS02_9GLOM|nr:13027_t:CDS:2 [Ambispora leptoticha]
MEKSQNPEITKNHFYYQYSNFSRVKCTAQVIKNDGNGLQRKEQYTEENWTFANWKEINESSIQNYKSFEPESNNLIQEVAKIFKEDDEMQSDIEGKKRAEIFKNLDSCRHDQKSDYDRISSQFSLFDEELRDIQREIEELETNYLYF